jgi:hypothetical protein
MHGMSQPHHTSERSSRAAFSSCLVTVELCCCVHLTGALRPSHTGTSHLRAGWCHASGAARRRSRCVYVWGGGCVCGGGGAAAASASGQHACVRQQLWCSPANFVIRCFCMLRAVLSNAVRLPKSLDTYAFLIFLVILDSAYAMSRKHTASLANPLFAAARRSSTRRLTG